MLAWGTGWEAFRVLSAFVIGQEHTNGSYLAERSRYVLQSFLRTFFRKLHVLGMNRHLWDSSPRGETPSA